MAKVKTPNSTPDQLCKELRGDLKKHGGNSVKDVTNDAPRKTFTAKIDGAILEFAHKQPDLAFWCGVKYYGSGSSSKVRMRRTQKVEAGETAQSGSRAATSSLVTETSR